MNTKARELNTNERQYSSHWCPVKWYYSCNSSCSTGPWDTNQGIGTQMGVWMLIFNQRWDR